MKIFSINGLNQTLLVAACLLALPSVTEGGTVTVDGIKTAGEYTGSNSGSKSIVWYNDHHSIYTLAAGNMNPLHWEINANASGGLFSLNLFFEVPAYARRMIWKDGVDYNGTNFNTAWGIPKAILDAYLVGAREFTDPNNYHHDSVNMSYNTQTSSEYFHLNGVSFPVIKWQTVDLNGLSDNFTWKNSREYIIANGLGTTSLSLNFDMTASIELMWNNFASANAAQAYVNNITDMQLHLSDEARGLPPIITVPESGSSLAMLGIALAGLAVCARRRAY